jgi:NAD(P)-dependent dehydrogenase (short-subunit alcohol dehydrogenase family)
MTDIRFDGKVVVITGAGRNLGREYALAFAARGARVVVNDLGVGISDTDGNSPAPEINPADDVVAEITNLGREAVANYDTIATPEGGHAIINTALSAFGTVDIVVNNAGQVRMAPFEDFPEESIDALLNTQLRGTLNVSRPAWKVMREKGGGRFVNVSSGAAFGGVPNGSVYGMAKMGAIGLTRGMAAEGKALGIVCNIVAPYAKTRPGSGFGPIPWSEELQEWLHPKYVSPLVLWLAHDSCPYTGETFSVGGGWYAGMNITLAPGFTSRDDSPEIFVGHEQELFSGEHSIVTPQASQAVRNLLKGFRGPT